MTLALDPPVLSCGMVIAGVARRHVWHLTVAGAVTVSGGKTPVAVLVHDGTALRGVGLAGEALSSDAARALVPGAEDRLFAAWQAAFGAATP